MFMAINGLSGDFAANINNIVINYTFCFVELDQQ